MGPRIYFLDGSCFYYKKHGLKNCYIKDGNSLNNISYNCIFGKQEENCGFI